MSTQAAYPKLLNFRSYVIDRLESRPGSARVNGVELDQTNVHTLKRLNDPVPGAALTYTRLVGAGTKLYSGQTAFTSQDTGYSGNPLSIVPFRPPQSPEAWAYVADSNKMRKIDVSGVNHPMGIAPPLGAPSIALGTPLTTIIEKFEATGSWANYADMGAITSSATSRINTTISKIIYDTGTTGWASVQPASMDGIRPGALLTTGATAETVAVQSVFRTAAATTIGSIAYDSGVSGLCTINPAAVTGSLFEPQYDENTTQVSSPVPLRSGAAVTSPLALVPGSLVLLGGTEVVQVLSVTSNQDGTASFRCSTVGTFAAGNAISILPTFRAYFLHTHAATATLKAGSFAATNSGAGNGYGYFQINAAYDLTQIASSTPTQPDDEIHISIKISDLTQLVEGNVAFDVDSATTNVYSATNDFTRNYYVHTFRQNDLVPAFQQQITTLNARQQAIQRTQIDQFGSEAFFGLAQPQAQGNLSVQPVRDLVGQPSVQTSTGKSQWTELHFKVSDLQRVGADTSRNLSNVQAIRVTFQTTASVNVEVSALTIEGGYGPDVGDIGSDYYYRVRGRSKSTGAISNPGPPTRMGLRAHRQQIIVSPVQHPDTQVDALDIFRFGGAITSWKYVGSTDNGATPAPLKDNYQDSDIANSENLDFDNYQPFPTIDVPHSGTCDVVGTRITKKTGDNFNTSWAPGSIINIAGIDCVLYDQPSSTTLVDVNQGLGTQTGVAWYTKQPTLLGQPLPCLWGPMNGFLFACGDNYQPGVLYETKGNNPDSAPDTNQQEITSPSEPLMNGCMYDGRAFVFSSDRMFAIYPTPDQPNPFTVNEVPNGKGLYSRWAICTGPRIWFLGRDGIYETAGGEPVSITAQDLYLLFPHDNIAGVSVTLGSATFLPPDMTQTAALRLSYADSHVKFDYIDTNGNHATIVYNTLLGVWGVDSYSYGSVTHYAEEGNGVHSGLIGGNDGFVYHEEGTQDNGVDFSSEIRMPYIGDLGTFLHGRDGYVPVLSNAACSLIVNADGTDYTHTVPSTAGAYGKQYTVLQPFKGKALEFSLTSTKPFTLFVRDCFFRMKSWAGEDYSPVNPFANLKRLTS